MRSLIVLTHWRVASRTNRHLSSDAPESSAKASTTSLNPMGIRRANRPSRSSRAIRFSSQTATGCLRSSFSPASASIPAVMAAWSSCLEGCVPASSSEGASVSFTIWSGSNDRPNTVLATRATSDRCDSALPTETMVAEVPMQQIDCLHWDWMRRMSMETSAPCLPR